MDRDGDEWGVFEVIFALVVGAIFATVVALSGCGHAKSVHMAYATDGPVIVSGDDAGLAPSRESTKRAVALVDKQLVTVGLGPVSQHLRVTWLATVAFTDNDEPDRWLLGLSFLSFSSGGLYCNALVSSHYQDKAALTAIAHEMLHCALSFSHVFEGGDGGHTDSAWKVDCSTDKSSRCGWLARTEKLLADAGL